MMQTTVLGISRRRCQPLRLTLPNASAALGATVIAELSAAVVVYFEALSTMANVAPKRVWA